MDLLDKYKKAWKNQPEEASKRSTVEIYKLAQSNSSSIVKWIFIIGILTGTFSSIFIASPVFYWWHKGDRRHVEEHQLTPKRYEWESSSEN